MEKNNERLKKAMSKVKDHMEKNKEKVLMTAALGLCLGGAASMKISEQHELKQEMKKMEQLDAQATPHDYTSFNLKQYRYDHTGMRKRKNNNDFVKMMEDNGFQIETPNNIVPFPVSIVLNISDANGKPVGMATGSLSLAPSCQTKKSEFHQDSNGNTVYSIESAVSVGHELVLNKVEVLDEATELMKLVEQNYEKSYSSKIWMVEGETLFSAHQRSEKLASHKNDHLNYTSHEFHL